MTIESRDSGPLFGVTTFCGNNRNVGTSMLKCNVSTLQVTRESGQETMESIRTFQTGEEGLLHDGLVLYGKRSLPVVTTDPACCTSKC